MSLKSTVWNTGIEGMECVSIVNLKMPSGMHMFVKVSLTFYDSCSLCIIPPSVFNVFNLI